MTGSGSQIAGESYTLICTVSGVDDTPTYQWLKNGTAIMETTQTLTFSPLNQADTSQYSCIVTNVASELVVLNVEGKMLVLTPEKKTLLSI